MRTIGVLITMLVGFAVAGVILLAMSLRHVQQHEKGVVFRLGRLLPDIRRPAPADSDSGASRAHS